MKRMTWKHSAHVPECFPAIVAGVLLGGFAWYLHNGMIDPLNTYWLLREGDSFQHFIGWHFYRQEAWQWPLGAISTLATDLTTSIVYTDSIPLYAIPLKLVNSWLPPLFQYLGLALFINYILNGYFACRLLLKLNVPAVAAVMGAVLMGCLPIVTARGLGIHGHEALTAHWLIFIALEYTLLIRNTTFRSVLSWLALLLIAVLMHFYLFFMVGVFWTAWWLRQAWWQWQRSSSLEQLVKGNVLGWGNALVTPGIVLLCMWSVGYFHLGEQSAASGGYGYYSAELLTFLNPSSSAWFFDDNFPSMSSLFSGWTPAIEGQYEGMAYMGAGLLLLCSVAAALYIKGLFEEARQAERPFHANVQRPDWTPVVIASVGLFLFALAGQVAFGGEGVALHYDILFAPFRDYLRSSGRMVWPLQYVLIIAALIIVTKRLKTGIWLPLLVLTVILQREDLRGWHEFIHDTVADRLAISYQEPLPYGVLRDDSLIPVWENSQRFIAFPATYFNPLRPYLWTAAEYQIPVNVAYLARANDALIENVTAAHQHALEQGRLFPGNTYLITDNELGRQACILQEWSCKRHQDVTIVWHSSLIEASSQADGRSHTQNDLNALNESTL
ncbi:hypothetical protein CZ787_07535 [Halomonas citrativorans]|uniref:Uncharacterized protein n=1 Tax=Halomonas citrativorans TaxID=2742612 RepID=A0A1R4HXM0_9GAMM|nr:DUF6311 domain-containing protein [Halomonas citrativorans]SJN12206.1 hypothetical protein CZ787_07535 [Halomonas citrativorans]